RVVPGAVDGHLDTIEIDGSTLRVEGWAATKSRAARRVAVFVDGRFMVAPQPLSARPDLARVRGLRFALAGFKIIASLDERADTGDVRVFGVADGRASELPRAKPD
ncbi:MAG TPA: hypothetical protein VFQ12_08065, partial [Thermoleophilaceae bacterium]|nr:hypothetical protein [Thermoleophilaceae bacterium]